MPGMIEHLYFCSTVCDEFIRNLQDDEKKDRTLKCFLRKGQIFSRDRFMLGGILPDLARDRNRSHWKVESRRVKGLFIPNMYDALRRLAEVKNWSLRLGIYAHLYLDLRFIVEFLVPKFEWKMFEKGEIRHLGTGEVMSVKEFFSGKGLYGAYAEINAMILENNLLDIDSIMEIGPQAPMTGLNELDDRVDESWKNRFETYLTHQAKETNRFFPLHEYLFFSNQVALDFANEVLQL